MLGLLRRFTGETGAGPDPALPIDRCRYVVLDTELTGLDVKTDSIVSIGAVAMQGGRIMLGETFYEMMSPGSSLTCESVVVHGITPSEVADKPCFGDVIADFRRFCGSAVLVGHFLSLDLSFLNKELRRITGRPYHGPAADTMQIHEWIRGHNGDFSRHYQGMAHNVDLFTMARKYQIQVSGAHNALMDAFITAQLFQRFLSFLPALGVRTVKELLKIGRP